MNTLKILKEVDMVMIIVHEKLKTKARAVVICLPRILIAVRSFFC